MGYEGVDCTENHESDTSLLSEISEADDNNSPWTTVAHRRSRSLDSLKKNTMTSNKVMIAHNQADRLTTEQDTVINQAEKQLTSAQKEQLSCQLGLWVKVGVLQNVIYVGNLQ